MLGEYHASILLTVITSKPRTFGRSNFRTKFCLKVNSPKKFLFLENRKSGNFLYAIVEKRYTIIDDLASSMNFHIVVVRSNVRDSMKMPLVFICCLESFFLNYFLGRIFFDASTWLKLISVKYNNYVPLTYIFGMSKKCLPKCCLLLNC